MTASYWCQVRSVSSVLPARSHLTHNHLQIANTSSPRKEVKEFQSIMSYIHTEMNCLAKDTECHKRKSINQPRPDDESLGQEGKILLSKIEAKEREKEEFASYMASLKQAVDEQMAEIAKLDGERGK